ncbi:MAG: hypothetical protein EOO48_06435 [Flavobacterium sp.]|nr:MAG: hypothetical protein EOO48_06435 [Flavobacterium sp.]
MDFKKSIALFTALLMLVSNAGFALTVHYCGGTLASVSSGFKTNDISVQSKGAAKSCCAMKPDAKSTHKKCCSDKTIDLKGKISDVIGKSSNVEMAHPMLIPVFQMPSFAALHTLKDKKLPSYYCDAHAPPLHKLYHQYIFYA